MAKKGFLSRLVKRIDKYRYDRRGREIYNAKNLIAHEYLMIKPKPELTDIEKKEIQEYWNKYGIKIKDYCWFQWYYGVTGKKDPRFIPQDIYSYIIWNHYDNKEFCLAWKDKNCFEKFLPDVPFPKVILKRVNGRYYDCQENILQNQRDIINTIQYFSNMKEVIVKDAWDSGEGRGVKKYTLADEPSISNILEEWSHSRNYLIQEVIEQNEMLRCFNDSSINTIRINSWRHNDEVVILNSTIRIGVKGQITDVCYIDGVEKVSVCAITSDGHFGDVVINQFGEPMPIAEFGIKSTDVVPQWDKIIDIVRKNHKKLDHFDIVGWDFTVDTNNNVICIEYNIKRPGTVFYQYVNGPFFGDYTEQVLEYLTKKDNQLKYIPSYMRIKK